MSSNRAPLPVRRLKVSAALEEIEFFTKNPGQILGLSTGIKRLDYHLNGLVAGRLILFVARPGVGKTTSALNVVLHVAKAGKRCVIFELEMSEPEVVKRLASIECGIPEMALRMGQFHSGEPVMPEHYAAFRKACERIADLPIGIYVGGMNTDQMWATMEDVGDRTDLVVVDHVGHFTDNPSMSQYQRMTYVSRVLKDMRLHFGEQFPILAIAQLNRGSDTREDTRPIPSDIRDTGAFEQDADQIVAIWREDYLSREEAVKDSRTELIVMKNRYGPTGTVYVNMSLATGKIYDKKDQ